MNLETCFARSRPTVVTEFKLTLALPICVAPLKIFDNANLPRLYHREDRCERRPHHQESLRALARRHDQLRAHLQNFVDADNVARRLKTLKGLSPYEFVYKAWDFGDKFRGWENSPSIGIYNRLQSAASCSQSRPGTL